MAFAEIYDTKLLRGVAVGAFITPSPHGLIMVKSWFMQSYSSQWPVLKVKYNNVYSKRIITLIRPLTPKSIKVFFNIEHWSVEIGGILVFLQWQWQNLTFDFNVHQRINTLLLWTIIVLVKVKNINFYLII